MEASAIKRTEERTDKGLILTNLPPVLVDGPVGDINTRVFNKAKNIAVDTTHRFPTSCLPAPSPLSTRCLHLYQDVSILSSHRQLQDDEPS